VTNAVVKTVESVTLQPITANAHMVPSENCAKTYVIAIVHAVDMVIVILTHDYVSATKGGREVNVRATLTIVYKTHVNTVRVG
jgi:hypothetical protein